MTAVLLDTNVVLDFALKREPFNLVATQVFLMLAEKNIRSRVSASAVTDLYFFIQKKHSDLESLEILVGLMGVFDILPVTEETIHRAIRSGMKDFEDAVQTEAARSAGIEIVITRDKTGFADSGLTVLSPEEFVEHLNEKQ